MTHKTSKSYNRRTGKVTTKCRSISPPVRRHFNPRFFPQPQNNVIQGASASDNSAQKNDIDAQLIRSRVEILEEKNMHLENELAALRREVPPPAYSEPENDWRPNQP